MGPGQIKLEVKAFFLENLNLLYYCDLDRQGYSTVIKGQPDGKGDGMNQITLLITQQVVHRDQASFY